MNAQHLSDEAIAAFADGVLTGHARERSTRHTATCRECAQAVAVQREAILALRAAATPSLPTGLLDRLRSVPVTTPIRTANAAVGRDGSTMFATFGSMTAAALVPASPAPPRIEARRARHVSPFVSTAAAVAVAGVLTVSSAAHATNGAQRPAPRNRPASVQPVDLMHPAVYGQAVTVDSVRHRGFAH